MAERSNLDIIDEFARAYGPIKSAISRLDLEAMAFIPTEPAGAWSINDHLVCTPIDGRLLFVACSKNCRLFAEDGFLCWDSGI